MSYKQTKSMLAAGVLFLGLAISVLGHRSGCRREGKF